MSRSSSGSSRDAGNLDGLVDGTNLRDCDPRGRWIAWHPTRAESEWEAYRDAYFTAYEVASKRFSRCA